MMVIRLMVNIRDDGFSNRPSIADVARLAGVSTATVSRCLNFPDRLRAETRDRVTQAVAELGYTPNFGARALASNRTNTIGAVIPTMDNAIFARGIQAVQEELGLAGVTLLIASSNYDPVQEAKEISVLMSRGADGLLLIGEARPDSSYELLIKRRMPFVLAWTWRPDSPHVCVGFDNRGAARELAERVVKTGHRRIAMIAGVTAWNDRAAERVAGVRAALDAAGVPLQPERLIEAEYSIDAGDAAFVSLMGRSPAPTAVMCGNDVLAAGALRAARRLGLSVPRDVSITGFDNIDLAEAVHPSLTTMHVPHRRMGAAAARALLALRDGLPLPGDLAFHTSIVSRSSLGAPPAE
ncbi:MAG: LacI family transcriptional regulator [Paracoccaceae bacterium]|jgi:LacI family transcriptional regulator